MIKKLSSLKILIGAMFMCFASSCDAKDVNLEAVNESLMNLVYEPLSEYEEYCKNYIYIKTEAEWNAEKTNGTLERLDNAVLEKKVPFVLKKDDSFADDHILITIDKYFKDKTFALSDFHMVDINQVDLIGDYRYEGGTGNQTYLLTLRFPSKENVIRSIKKLEIYAFTLNASPDLIQTIAK